MARPAASHSGPSSSQDPPEHPDLERALDCVVLLDFDHAFEAVDRWLVTLQARALQPGAVSFILFDAACRIHRMARTVDAHAGISEDRRLILAQRLGLCESFEESVVTFMDALREIAAGFSRAADKSEAVEKARDFIMANFRSRISLTDVAHQAGISPNYLSHLFRRECGATLTQFVNRLRVREALRLLRGGSQSISEIGCMVGYQNYRDFHRNFVKYEKSPPRRFRPVSATRSGSDI